MNGYVLVTCNECKNDFRTGVNFPYFNKGFKTKITNCPYCEVELQIYDAHKYNEDGTIYE